MAIDKFSTEDFEAALPVDRNTGRPIWVDLGIEEGERAYAVLVRRKDGENLRIKIRSSIDYSGYAADTGEDSIRVWIEAEHKAKSVVGDKLIWVPVGKEAGQWITRQNGWNIRLIEKLRNLWGMAMNVNRCTVCGAWKRIYRVRKDTPNKGRLFSSCPDCKLRCGKDQFEWLTEVA